ncbi:class I SAM-dependent methyltransferase [Baaleninema simplex]|uniref:class I SAM-dependent methyltransferase n=1 Tax=Baaleninema simplex TaxID=2862350 RepID=UPI0003487E23|nr:SAM-dependent methyltransferase [Baaleninema simplex]
MKLNWKNSTNKGTLMLKLVHQFQTETLFTDKYIRWFFDRDSIQALEKNPPNMMSEPKDEEERFQKIAYLYVILREKYGDDIIESAIEAGCQQILLLGAGYDTRFFRLSSIQNNSVKTFEVDLPETIENKKQYLLKQFDNIPHGLSLIPLDLNQDDLDCLVEYGFNPQTPTIYIWQGVSYYLNQENVSNTLDFIKNKMTPGSVFVFDCCSPLMTFKNETIPGINFNIDRLAEIGEPYRFGMYGDEMERWLSEKGFQNIEILQQDDLEERFLNKRSLPNNMWYIVTVKTHSIEQNR